MELTTSDMSQRQRDYRATYRSRVAGWYNGWLHVAIIYTMGFTALYIYISNIHSPSLLEWITVPVTFLICNFFRVVDSSLRHAPPLKGSAVQGGLFAPHADAPSVLYRSRDALWRPSRLARNIFPAVFARRVHADVDPWRAHTRMGRVTKRRLAVHHDNDVDVSHL